ncbi:Bifunctional inhibitor/plant lipid transfer protein/seed storage helical domain containing protein [Parasponia andersonii]|uniref:Bifunctional inhibitor/plant lipid transfer protein/seed storage helical domain containing protein n=1 Tax=Parasponia andersonii TaxID=3476 RepID=A0A2P5BYG8_PARAD|nr:Bifunctional inhibitor/plant lipid transfer protein/seed storage helical domain containing protein [Parasponia andersonii]
MSTWAILVAVVLAAAASMTSLAGPPIQNPVCAQKLVPCSEFLNSTKPPESCCSVMRTVVHDELPCVCNILTTPSMLTYFHLNQTQALRLLSECRSAVELSECQALAPDASDHRPPPAIPGGNTYANAAISRAGINTLVLSLIWASVVYILIGSNMVMFVDFAPSFAVPLV